MRKRASWTEEMEDLKKQGYKFNEQGECIYDPLYPLQDTNYAKPVQGMAKQVIVEPRASQVAKKAIVEETIRIKLPKKLKKRGK